MASVSSYLNFNGTTEEAFEFYKRAFRTDYVGVITRMGSVPPMEGMPALSEDEKNLIMNIQLPITGGHVLMGTDATESMGFTVNFGNNIYIMVEPDFREEADRLFAELSADGNPEMPMSDQFWGDYFGSLIDRFGVRWMVNHHTAN